MNYNIYFSPTGGTKKVTSLVSEQFSSVKDIDLSLIEDFSQYEFNQDDFCIVGVPSFGGRVPAIAIERLAMMKAHQTPVCMIVTYGNRAYEDTLLELKDTLKQQGFLPFSAMACVCEHSIMHQFGQGRPNQQDQQQIIHFTKNIKERLTKELTEIEVPGQRPYKEYHGIPLKPTASKKCIECGICAKSCPVQAIDIRHPQQTDKDKCISCMRCIAVCPTHARKNNPVLLAASVQKLKKACQQAKENELF